MPGILAIENLFCSYSLKKSDAVLYVPYLDIPMGELVFLIGASGSGKSTLLETIGLMNNTIADGDVILNLENNFSHHYSSLWQVSKIDELSDIRRKYLSFIFQNTNLMENFTAYENICLSRMIKDDIPQQEAMYGASELMNKVGLPLSEVGIDKLSVNLSGGQRQRVSFVRALNNDFKLLLCDEPTGNLDEVNATELMKIVRDNIGNGKSAVVVSHDINLALKYADRIVIITIDNDKNYGIILPENIYERRSWSDNSEEELLQFRKKLMNLLKFEVSVSNNVYETNSVPTDVGKTKVHYKSLFNLKEGKVLFGRSYVNLLILIAIISITFIAIGFANGALSYLDKKYSDPFVRLLPIEMPWSKSQASTVKSFTDQLSNEEIKSYYRIDTVTTYTETLIPIFNFISDSITERIRGRTIAYDDPFNEYLFSKDNLVFGDLGFRDDKDLGIVITQKTLKRLDYPDDARVIFLNNEDVDETSPKLLDFKVPIPIRAVVKELPGRNNLLMTGFFNLSYRNNNRCVFDFREHRKRLMFYVPTSKLAGEFGRSIEKFLEGYEIREFQVVNDIVLEVGDETIKSDSSLSIDIFEGVENSNEGFDDSRVDESRIFYADVWYDMECDVFPQPGYEVSVNLDYRPTNYQTTELLYKKIIELETYKNNSTDIVRILDYYNAPLLEDNYSNDYLCVIFSERGLDSIPPFAKYIESTFNAEKVKDETHLIKVDPSAVQEKNNFNYLGKMTRLISGLLIAFSILSISLFISNLLKTHLNKVKMNLGTYKAFGLSDKESIGIYLRIMLKFTLLGLVVSFVISFVGGNLAGFLFGNWLQIADNDNYFQLFAGQTYFLIFIIVFVTILTSYVSITKILSKTPGDLIYNR